jgi:hypothetical protein
MANGAAVVVGAGGVKRFAGLIRKNLTVQASSGPYEVDCQGPEVAAALTELNEAVAAVTTADRGHGVLFVPEDRTAALLMSFLASQAAAHGAGADEGFLEAQLAQDDVCGWVAKFVPAWLKGRFKKQPFVVPSGTTIKVANDFRLAVLGDWGSGLYGAPLSAASIQIAKPAFDSLLHLGDVYYAGTKQEVAERFLNLWPDVRRASSWALNSNHEMYSGGEGYFGVTLADARFATQQGASCFAWENDHFLFLGLDTGYQDHDIGDEQRAWILDVAGTSSKKLILFSHHQPFSAFEKAGPKLVVALGKLLEARRVAAWYWGHEHRCVFFEQHEEWSLWGRCVGHGGYPELRDKFEGEPESTNPDGSSWRHVQRAGVPDAWVLDGPNPNVREHSEKYAPNGYVALHFDGPVVHEKVHAPDGTLLLAKDVS